MASFEPVHKQPKTKQCAFPGCETVFKRIGRKQYCIEHAKPKYREALKEYKAKEEIKIV